MDFQKYLPKFLIVKNVFNFDNSTTHRFFITTSKEINSNFLIYKNIQSWHPFIVRDGNNFYYFKGLKKSDFLIASFCLNNESFEQDYNNLILENYFNKNSFEI